MPRVCTVCTHPDRGEIETALLERATFRTITARFGPSKAALIRHRKEHVTAALVRAAARKGERREETLRQKVDRLESDARRYAETAEHDGDLRAALMANRTLLDVIRFMHELHTDGGAEKSERMARRLSAHLGIPFGELMQEARNLETLYGDDAPPLDPPAPPPAPKPVEIPRPIPAVIEAPTLRAASSPVPAAEAEPRIPEAEPVVPVPTLLEVARAGLERPRVRAPEPERESVYRPNFDIEFLP